MEDQIEKIYMIISLRDGVIYQGETVSLSTDERYGVFPVYKTRQIAEKYAEKGEEILEFDKVTKKPL